MRRERDKQSVRAVGAICLGLGLIVVPLTILATLSILLTTAGRGDLVKGATIFFTAIVMGSTMMSCGTVLQQLRLLTDQQVDSMRMSWTGLLIVMVAGGAVGVWAMPGL